LGWVLRTMTKLSAATVLKSLPSASTDRLVSHYNRYTELYRLAYDDIDLQAILALAQIQVARELQKRGIETPMSNAWLGDEAVRRDR